MQKNFWLVVLLVLAGMVALFALTGTGETENKLPNYDPTVIQLGDEIQGLDVEYTTQAELDEALEGKTVLVEYADFQCPGCQFFFGVLDQIKRDFADTDLVVVFRHFPITQIHPQAMAAHRATVAASNQGAFWEMHDLIYQRQNEWSGRTDAPGIFENYATELGLDVEQYTLDAEAEATFNAISNDLESATPLSIVATPSVVLNGELLENTPSYEELTEILNEELGLSDTAEEAEN